MTAGRRQKPDDWLKHPDFVGLQIMDPDGWDRRNFKASWAEPITRAQFEERVCNSTCLWPKGLLGRISNAHSRR